MSDLDESEQLQRQLAAYRRTLAVYLRQLGNLGSDYAPPGIHNGIAEARAEIARLKAALRARGVAVTDEANDDERPAVQSPQRIAWRSVDRAAMLAKMRHTWIDGVLKQSLWHDALIALRLAERPDAVARPYGLRLRSGADETTLPEGTTIQDVYAAQQGALLILGQPGSGKTTLLLELADTLLDQAKRDEAYPIPVVFNLATWTEQQTLAKWLVVQLHREYDVPKKIGQAWVDAGAVLPLLDGLDEVATPRRTACVEAINAYRRQHEAAWATPIVVCCRSVEYETLPPLRLHGAIVVQPLTRPEIDVYLSASALVGVRAAVKDDLTLYAVLATPLLLAVTTLAFADQPTVALRRAGAPEEWRRAIFAAYIVRVFRPPPQGKGVDPRYGQERMLRWLAWLARQMRAHDQSIYWIEFMQADWLPRRWMQWGVYVMAGLAGGGVAGVVGGASGVSIGSLFGGTAGAVAVGLAIGLTSVFAGVLVSLIARIEPVDAIRWSGRRIFVRGIWMFAFVGGLVVILDRMQQAGLISELSSVLLSGLSGGLFGLLLSRLGGGLDAYIIDQRTRPNEGFWRSIRYGMIIGVVSTLILGLSVGLGTGLGANLELGVGLGIGLVIGIFNGLQYGGAAVLKQITLRLLLFLSHTFPWNITAFLDSCAARGLVQRVGGGWRFPHNLIRDYFAELEVGEEERQLQ